MAVLKLSTAASFYGKPYKFARNITATTTTTTTPPSTAVTATASFINSATTAGATTTTTTQHSSSHSPSHSLSITTSLNSNTTNWRRITPYAHLSYNSSSSNTTNNKNNANLLGFSFRSHKHLSLFSRNSSSTSSPSSSSSKFSGSDSSSSGSGLVADMGSENKIEDVDWCHNSDDHLNGQKHKQQQQDSHSKLLTLPTILTLGRVAAVPLLISTFYVDSWLGRTATTSIFIAAAVTDWLDGYLARKMRLGSAFGAFLDPVADKLMVAATLVLLCTKPLEVAIFGQKPWLLTVPAIAIIGREITMSAVREWAASQNTKLLEAVAVNNLGKWKTATQMTALTILLFTRDSGLGGAGILAATGVVLLYISAGLSIWSLGVYMSKIWRVLLK